MRQASFKHFWSIETIRNNWTFNLTTYHVCIRRWVKPFIYKSIVFIPLRCMRYIKRYPDGFSVFLHNIRRWISREDADLNYLWLVLQQTSPGCRRIDCRFKTNPEVRSIDPPVVIFELNKRLISTRYARPSVYLRLEDWPGHIDRFLVWLCERVDFVDRSRQWITWYECGNGTSWLWMNEHSGLQRASIIGRPSLAGVDSRSLWDHRSQRVLIPVKCANRTGCRGSGSQVASVLIHYVLPLWASNS